MKLTKRSIDGLSPSNKDIVVWDDFIGGFGVRVRTSGSKTFVFQYRNSVGRSRRKTIGKYGIITADQARKDALKLKVLVTGGVDPVADKQAIKEAPDFNVLLDRYLLEHVEVHNKPQTVINVTAVVNNHIRPVFGDIKVENVSRDDVIKLHRKMRATPRQANYVLSVLSKVFNLAEDWELRRDFSNPTRRVKRYPENVRNRILSDEELSLLGKHLEDSVQSQLEQFSVVTAIRLLALTGCRLSEILNLKWQYIEFNTGILNLPDAKAGARSQVLSDVVLEILLTVPRTANVPWVLANKTQTGPLDKSNMERAWRRIRSNCGIEDVRLHDLRHMFGTVAGASGANAFQVRDLLGHKSLAMTGRYVAQSIDPQRELVNLVSNQIRSRLMAV